MTTSDDVLERSSYLNIQRISKRVWYAPPTTRTSSLVREGIYCLTGVFILPGYTSWIAHECGGVISFRLESERSPVLLTRYTSSVNDQREELFHDVSLTLTAMCPQQECSS